MKMSLMKIVRNLQIALGALVLWISPGVMADTPPVTYEPRHGDVLFQSLGHSPLIDMIEGSTDSTYSHCGIVAQKTNGWFVIEAVGPVREIKLEQWIANGRGKGFAAYRLKSAFATNAAPLVNAAREFLGAPYDIHYEMDDAKIYCSELVFKAYRKAGGAELGQLTALRDLNWRPYEALIRQIENGGLPLERKIITPVAVSKASQLELVFSRGMDAEGKPGK